MMSGFAPFGYGSVLLALLCGAWAFYEARRRLALAWYLNLPGAGLVAASIFLVTGWLFTVSGVIADTMGAGFGGVPFDNALNSMMMAVSWYWLCWSVPRWFNSKSRG